MTGKRWVMFGCGGCLGVVVLLVILGGVGYWWISDYTQGIQQSFQNWSNEKEQLESEFPFTPPDESVLPDDPDSGSPEPRLQQFINARRETVQTAEEKLQWLLEWSGYRESEDKMGTIESIRKMIGLPKDISEIGIEQLNILRREQMPFSEYQHFTRIVAAEIVSWTELPEDDPLRAWGGRYLEPLDKIEEEIAKIREQNPSSEINAEMFRREEFINTVQQWQNPNHPHRELIGNHKEALIDSSVGTLVDVVVLQSGDNSSKPRVQTID